jgi:oxygen-dependent protoporphyrinogen oxidase
MTTASSQPLDVLVVGAGISGLTTAFHLARGGRRVAVVESSPRVGGAVQTHDDGPWRFELGPNTVLENHPAVTRLITEAGLDGEKLTASPQAKRRYLWKGGRLVPLPSSALAFLGTSLFPAGAKLRLLREPWIAPARRDADESIADFVRRRIGQAFLDYAVGPFVSGVYAGDPERLSVRWAVPKIYALERDHGSLIRGAFAKRKGPAPGGAMISLRGGLEELPRHLARVIGDVRTGLACARVLAGDGVLRAETAQGAIEARRLVVTAPADVAASLLADLTAGASLRLQDIPYAAVAVVSLGYRRADVAHALDGFGFLVPRKEGLKILGCLFPSTLFPARAPEGHVALSAFVGGSLDGETPRAPEESILATVEAEVARALGTRAAPVYRLVRRWPRAIPQYELGHGRFVELGQELENRHPGLHLGGNWLRGVSVPDCIKNATALAEEILALPA